MNDLEGDLKLQFNVKDVIDCSFNGSLGYYYIIILKEEQGANI